MRIPPALPRSIALALCVGLWLPTAPGRAAPVLPPLLSPAAPSPAPAPSPSASSVVATEPLTLEAAIRAALATDPSLEAARLEIEASAGAVRQAGAWPNPELGIEQEDVGRDTRATTVRLSQALELGGKRAARAAVARKDWALAESDFALRRAAIRADTTEAYFDALIARERVRFAEESTAIADSGVEAAARRVAAGKIAPTEETRARVDASLARVELDRARTGLTTAGRRLMALIGQPAATPPLLDEGAGALPIIVDPADLARRVGQSPLLARSASQIERAAAVRDLEQARRIPDLTVTVGNIRAADTERNQLVVGFAIPLPVFDRNAGARLEAQRRLEAARYEARAVERTLRTDVFRLDEQIRADGREATMLSDDVLPGARSAWEAARRGFELGKFGFLDVLDAQRTWLQARSRYLDTVARIYRDAAELDRLLGLPEATSAPIRPGVAPTRPSAAPTRRTPSPVSLDNGPAAGPLSRVQP